ncbi:MAG: zf-TFIIB domain-containing protein [Candidatus Gastranaerophilales bacterium]|nr:zf-TFIIB domain-containing protein [Candidatus Gastranaerophilales bacterium]
MADNVDVILNCPACGKPMKKVYMDEQNLYLDVCLDGCGGIYFDNREYKKFDEGNEDISPLIEAYKNKTFNEISDSEERVCPKCNSKMVKHYSSSKYEIQIDDCYSCGGIFLDYGELKRIRSEYLEEQHRTTDVLQQLDDNIGSYLREREIRHSNINDRSFFRKHCSNLVKEFVLKFQSNLETENIQ